MRLLAVAIVGLLSSALALAVTAWVLDDMRLEAGGFVVAVVVYGVVLVIAEPLVRRIAVRNAPALVGSSTLVATFASLVVTTAISDDMAISGAMTWITATALVWLVALVPRFVLPFLVFRQVLRERRD